MKNLFLLVMIVVVAFLAAGCNGSKAKAGNDETRAATVDNSRSVDDGISTEARIQIAMLLDTSSSMDGLIDQAKARLWNIVNTMTTLKYNGKMPEIEIALYEYGNDGLSRKENYIRQVVPLTTDLDLISEKLFALSTNGGSEYCGAVIQQAVKELQWKNRKADMKLIYIAGNEPFTQGPISYKDAISGALDKNIYVNTIHCGNDYWGGMDTWRDGAKRGKGKFFNIDHDQKVRHYATPYDDRITECNIKLNDTYVGYGVSGVYKKQSQMTQDENARSISSANYAERAVTKTKSAYKNTDWDLVDKVKEDKSALDKIKQSDLPEELQNKSKEEIKIFIAEKEKQRNKLQTEIAQLAKKRQEYIDDQIKKDGENAGDDLGEAINQSAIDIALALGYVVEK